MAWSGGKDSARALHLLMDQHDVVALLTTLTRGYDRISMHGVRRTLLEAQAASVRLPIAPVWIAPNCTNEEYEASMREVIESYLEEGIMAVAFGDIFLEDLRKYREAKLALLGMHGIFPLWKRDTRRLAREFIDLGFKAVVCCVDSKVLEPSFAGREFDDAFLADLPKSVDPCGENGEFHSFVYDGPPFREEIPFARGEIVLREERFYYCDLIPRGPIAR